MKKTFFISLLLLSGLSFQAQAASTNSNQGTKAGQIVPRTQGNQGVGNTVQTNEQNKVKNQGEEPRIQTQEQNTIQTEDGTEDEANKGNDNKNKENKGRAIAETHRSVVADFVQNILAIADREGGIGQQVRVIAERQNDAKDQTADGIEAVENRNKIKTFFFGPDFKNVGDLRNQMVQTRNQIAELSRLADKADNDQDKNELKNQIQTLSQEQANLESFIKQNENKFSLFGWVANLFNK